MFYALPFFSDLLQLCCLSGFSILRLIPLCITCSLYCFTLFLFIACFTQCLLTLQSFELSGLETLNAGSVCYSFYHLYPGYHVIVMLSHVQTLLTRLYKITRTMIQYVLF